MRNCVENIKGANIVQTIVLLSFGHWNDYLNKYSFRLTSSSNSKIFSCSNVWWTKSKLLRWRNVLLSNIYNESQRSLAIFSFLWRFGFGQKTWIPFLYFNYFKTRLGHIFFSIKYSILNDDITTSSTNKSSLRSKGA